MGRPRKERVGKKRPDIVGLVEVTRDLKFKTFTIVNKSLVNFYRRNSDGIYAYYTPAGKKKDVRIFIFNRDIKEVM